MSNTDTMREVYLLAQEHCGLKVGDCVKVTRKAESNEAGWVQFWTSDMDEMIGNVYEIIRIVDSGIELIRNKSWIGSRYMPYFVLEKVEKPAHEFKPFERVLVRDDMGDTWRANVFSHKSGKHFPYVAVSGEWKYCIPYEGNEHLVGTTDNPEE